MRYSRNKNISQFAKHWLLTGVLALAISGIFSIILVVARTPGLSELPFWKEMFHVSLVIHVDLSVWVWFFAILAVSWSLMRPPAKEVFGQMAEPFALWAFFIGLLCMALAPLEGEWQTFKSNYIPVLHNPVFFFGLGLMLASIIIASAQTVWTYMRLPCEGHATERSFIAGSAFIALCAMLTFVASALLIDESIAGLGYFEHVFWAGGHIAQFATVQLMLLIWIQLATQVGWVSLPSAKAQRWMAAVGPAIIAYSFIPFLLYPVSSQEFQDIFTLQMNVGGGAVAIILVLYFMRGWHKAFWPNRENRMHFAVLMMSLLLFGLGGAFGAAIDGQNVKIPAHYHGSIVAVTIAFMGYAYTLLPRFGYADVSKWRMSFIQPILYGVGQMLHITGLAVSGGYGVLRKTAGGFDALEPSAKLALQMMGGGGLLAIIGGLLFVVVVVRAMRQR